MFQQTFLKYICASFARMTRQTCPQAPTSPHEWLAAAHVLGSRQPMVFCMEYDDPHPSPMPDQEHHSYELVIPSIQVVLCHWGRGPAGGTLKDA